MGRFSLTSPALQYLAPARIPCTMCDRSHSTEVLVLDEEVQRIIHHLKAHVTAYQPKCSQLSCLANAHRLHLYVLIIPQQRLQDWLKVLPNLRTYVSEVHLYSSLNLVRPDHRFRCMGWIASQSCTDCTFVHMANMAAARPFISSESSDWLLDAATVDFAEPIFCGLGKLFVPATMSSDFVKAVLHL